MNEAFTFSLKMQIWNSYKSLQILYTINLQSKVQQ